VRGIAAPHNVQASPDGTVVWTTSAGAGLVGAIDAETQALLHGTRVGEGPAHVVVSPDGQTTYATVAGDNRVAVIEADDGELLDEVTAGRYPHGLRTTPDGRLVVVANMQSGTVSILDTREPGRGDEIRVGRTPVQVAVSPDGRFVYVSLNEDDAVAKLDLRSGKVVARARTCRGPIQVYLTPGGETLLAACQGTPTAPNDELDFVDTATMRVTGTLATGAGAHGVVVEPSGRHAYVTNVWDGTVAVVDLATRKVVDRIVVGGEPNGVSFSPLRQPHARGAANMRSPREVVVPLGGRTDGSTGGGHSH